MTREKIDTRAIGLDVGLEFVRWLTGTENLHYGYWDGLDVTAGNLGAAQEAYTARLFYLLPDGPLRILDIGGGAGETARKLLDLGHSVHIVVPSPLLASRCRDNAPGATVTECRFEDFQSDDSFDLCLFSESYQYVPLDIGIPRCLELLAPGGEILIADCFRSEALALEDQKSVVGGGHLITQFREKLAGWPVEVLHEEDITRHTAPSVEIEQKLFNVIGYAINRVGDELQEKRPVARWSFEKLLRLFLNDRRRARLDQRLNQSTRNREVFAQNNVYLMMRLARASD